MSTSLGPLSAERLAEARALVGVAERPRELLERVTRGTREALAVHGSRISLLLTDMVMPSMGGRELIEHASMMFPMLRIAVMSGYTEDNALRQGHLAGEHAFISKPFTVEDLMATVRRVLDGTHDRRAAPPSMPLLAPVS